MLRFVFGAVVAAMFIAPGALSAESSVSGPAGNIPPVGETVITRLKPDHAVGRGYRMVFTVNAPLEVAWGFKTDYENQDLLTNKLISAHRLVSRNGNEVITESVFANKPKLLFRWKITLFPEQHMLRYVLLNPQACGQYYHNGTIQLEAVDAGTRITQVAYFDFFGVSLWVNYPFSGGMSHFLEYTAQWEQQAVLNYWRQSR